MQHIAPGKSKDDWQTNESDNPLVKLQDILGVTADLPLARVPEAPAAPAPLAILNVLQNFQGRKEAKEKKDTESVSFKPVGAPCLLT